jgi:hypothetical protein
MVRRLALTFAVLVALAGCGPATSDLMGEDMCVHRALNAVLTVDTDDPRVVWATNAAGLTIDLRLPPDYGVTDDNQIIDADGHPIGHSGDVITGGCSDLLEDAMLITEANIRPAP